MRLPGGEKPSRKPFAGPKNGPLCTGDINMQSNRVLAYKKPSVYKAFLTPCHHSQSTAIKQFCLPNIVRAICVAFDYLIDPYYPAYHPSYYRFVIGVDNGRFRLWINTMIV